MEFMGFKANYKNNHGRAPKVLVFFCVIATIFKGCSFSETDRMIWSQYHAQGKQAGDEKRYNDAEKSYEKAVEIADKGRLGDETLIESLNDLAETYRMNNRSEKCITPYKKAINTGERLKGGINQYFTGSSWQLALLKSYLGLMEIYGDLGYYRDAEYFYNKAKDFQATSSDASVKSIDITVRHEHILKKRAVQRSLELTDIPALLNGPGIHNPRRERYFKRLESAEKTMRSGKLSTAQRELESLLADTKVQSGIRHHRYRDTLRLLLQTLRQQNKLAQLERLLIDDMRNYDYATAQGLDYERQPDTVIDAQRWLEDARQLLEVYRFKRNTDLEARQLLGKMHSVRTRTGVHTGGNG